MITTFRIFFLFFFLGTIFLGCGTVATIGGAAYGGYASAVDERSIGTILDDSVISTKVKSRMISDEFVKARHIDVDVLNGVVILSGSVESESQKRMAADIARGVEDVRKVLNQLTVGSITAGQILDDTVLSGKIKTEFIRDPDVHATNIDVDTHNNIITLTGIVGSQKEKFKALSIARKVGKNRPIQDNLVIKP